MDRLTTPARYSCRCTTLLHEAYFKMKERSDSAFPDEPHFLAYAARAMRTLVIDYARNRQAGTAQATTTAAKELPYEVVSYADRDVESSPLAFYKLVRRCAIARPLISDCDQ